MSSFIIIILAIILLALILLNNIKIVSTGNGTTANCSQTTFGCCPNGVDSKINFYGTNCPAYNPGPGYLPGPGPPGPMLPRPIGGCAGTRYGCCANNQTPKINAQGSNCVLNQ